MAYITAARDSSSCKFEDLPQEILDKIYTHLFAGGHVAIRRTSKMIYWSSRPALENCATFQIWPSGAEGVGSRRYLHRTSSCRVWGNNNFQSGIPSCPRYEDPISHRQLSSSVNLWCDLRAFDDWYCKLPAVMSMLATNFSEQKVISMTLQNFHTSDRDQARALLTVLQRTFSQYEVVIIRAIAGPIWCFKGLPEPGSGSDRGQYRFVTRARNRSMYHAVSDLLETALGKATWHIGEAQTECYLEFRPPREQSSVSGRALEPREDLEALRQGLRWTSIESMGL